MSSKVRQAIYLVLAVLGVVLTWWQNLSWFAQGELADKTLTAFWTEAFATHVSSSLALDIAVMGMAGFVLVWVEARKHGMSRWWPLAYLVLGNLIAVAFMFPLFLCFRERTLARLEAGAPVKSA